VPKVDEASFGGDYYWTGSRWSGGKDCWTPKIAKSLASLAGLVGFDVVREKHQESHSIVRNDRMLKSGWT